MSLRLCPQNISWEISWSLGMYNPILPDSRQYTYTISERTQIPKRPCCMIWYYGHWEKPPHFFPFVGSCLIYSILGNVSICSIDFNFPSGILSSHYRRAPSWIWTQTADIFYNNNQFLAASWWLADVSWMFGSSRG